MSKVQIISELTLVFGSLTLIILFREGADYFTFPDNTIPVLDLVG